jgi:hypothetical protein
VLFGIFVGVATLGGVFMVHVAVANAAEAGVQALANGQTPTQVTNVVASTLAQEGFDGVPTTTATNNGPTHAVTVSVPFQLWNTDTLATISATQTLTTLTSSAQGSTSSSTTSSPTIIPIYVNGGGGYVYHHFPMW